MIRLQRDSEVDGLLTRSVVSAQLRLTSTLAGAVLGSVTVPSQGRVRWDETDRRGVLDVDVADPGLGPLSPSHPFGAFGQVLAAEWWWPELGFGCPAGWWLVSPSTRQVRPGLWAVVAEPVGPARLARARWRTPPEQLVSGHMSQQVGHMVGEARVGWRPDGTWTEQGLPDSVCRIGETVTATLGKILELGDAVMRPERNGAGVLVSRRIPDGDPVLTFADDGRDGARPAQITADLDTEPTPNAITVWFERDLEGGGTEIVSWSEYLQAGPRRWDGPYGRVPADRQVDGPVEDWELRLLARRLLRDAQLSEASVKIETRADPRLEVGDMVRVLSSAERVDAVCRVTGIELSAGPGLATVEAAVMSGTVAGTQVAMTDPGL